MEQKMGRAYIRLQNLSSMKITKLTKHMSITQLLSLKAGHSHVFKVEVLNVLFRLKLQNCSQRDDFPRKKASKSKPLTFQSVGSYQRIRSGMFSLDRISSKHCWANLDGQNLCLGLLKCKRLLLHNSIMVALTVTKTLTKAQVLQYNKTNL